MAKETKPSGPLTGRGLYELLCQEIHAGADVSWMAPWTSNEQPRVEAWNRVAAKLQFKVDPVGDFQDGKALYEEFCNGFPPSYGASLWDRISDVSKAAWERMSGVFNSSGSRMLHREPLRTYLREAIDLYADSSHDRDQEAIGQIKAILRLAPVLNPAWTTWHEARERHARSAANECLPTLKEGGVEAWQKEIAAKMADFLEMAPEPPRYV